MRSATSVNFLMGVTTAFAEIHAINNTANSQCKSGSSVNNEKAVVLAWLRQMFIRVSLVRKVDRM